MRIADIAFAVSIAFVILWCLFDRGGAYDATKFFASVGLSFLALVAVATRKRALLGLTPSVVFIPCLLWIGGFAQTVPLPAHTVHRLSPGSADAYEDWIPDEVESLVPDARPNRWIPLSISPDLTRKSLGCLALFFAAAWLTRFWSGCDIAVLVFLIAMAVGGAVLSVVGVRGQPSSSFGPFVNNNNAGIFLNIALGCGCAAIGLLRSSTVPFRLGLSIGVWIAITATTVGLLGTNSRGSLLGLAAGGLGFFAYVCRNYLGRRASWLTAFTLAAAWTSIVGLGLWSRLVSRVETLWTAEALSDPRVNHWNDGIRASMEYFPMGSGLGTYRYAYLPFQRDGSDRWFVHADGMPVEWLLEGGCWVLPIVVAGIFLATRNAFTIGVNRSKVRGDSVGAEAFVAACVFVVPAVIVTQCFDFGILQLPSFLALASLLGGLSHHAQWSSGESDQAPSLSRRRFSVARSLAQTCFLCVILSISVFDFFVASEVERIRHERTARLRQPIEQIGSQNSNIATVERLCELKPNDASVRLLLANLLMDEQRRLGARFLVQHENIDSSRVGGMVSPRAIRRALKESKLNSLEQILLPSQDIKSWRSAQENAARALVACPFSDESRVLMIELDSLEPSFEELTPKLLVHLRTLRVGNRSSLRFYRQL